MCECNATAGKKTRDSNAAWTVQDTHEGKPHAWVQWKGTAVCMDVRCACGHSSHVDAEFAYHVECPACHRVYMCNGHIELIEIAVRPEHVVIDDTYGGDYGSSDRRAA